MSDEAPPPKPKPGSLRDRIKAFEQQNAAAPAPAPPPTRPKPGNVQWKPKPASPPASPSRNSTDAGSAAAVERARAGGMSAADAKESIGKGGSLKERMAALQGRGAFGAPAGPTSPPLAPKPTGEKPKWKPPPAPVALPEEEGATPAPEHVQSPPAGSDTEAPKAENEEQPAPEGEEAQGEADPEEEERKRRAEIAARMARLGGARIGMTPPVPGYGKKPPVKKEAPPPEAVETDKMAEIPKVEEVKPLAESGPEEPPVKSPIVSDVPVPGPQLSKDSEEEGYFRTSDSTASSLLSPDSTSTTSAATSIRSPSSMPVPAGPRRAGPPRRKAPAKSSQPILDEPIKESPTETPALETPAPEVEAKAEDPAELKQALEEVPAGTPVPESGADAKEEAADEEQAPKEDLSALGASHADTEIEDLHKEVEAEKAAEEKQVEEQGPLLEAEEWHSQEQEPLLEAEAPVADEPVETHHEPEAEVAAPVQEEKHEEPEEEEEEEARRKRVAERLAKMGGVNPFAARPPGTPSTDRPEPARKQSLGFTAPSSPSLERRESTDSQVAPTSPSVERRTSVDSVGIGRRPSAGATSRKSSMDVSMSPPPVPASPRPQPARRKSSVGSVGGDIGQGPPPVPASSRPRLAQRKSSRGSVSEDVVEGAPPVPTSPRPEVPQRRTSVGSVKSIGEPRRRQSEDEWTRREVSVSSQPPVQEEQEGTEFEEAEEPESAVPAPDVGGRLRRPESPFEVEGEVEHQESAKYEDEARALHEPEDETEDEVAPVSGTTPIPVTPPAETGSPPMPNLSTRPVIVQQETTLETSTESPISPAESVRRSAPPPRAPSVVATEPVTESAEDVYSPLPRRSVPPPPLKPEEDLEEEQEEYQGPNVIPEHEDEPGHHSEVAGHGDQAQAPYSPVHHVPPPPRDTREETSPVPELASDEIHDEAPMAPVAPPAIPKSTRPVSAVPQTPVERPVPPPLVLDVHSEGEVMDDSDGDPIDPQFHSPQRSPGLPPIGIPGVGPVPGPPPLTSLSSPPAETPSELHDEHSAAQPAEQEEDPEQARRRTIAERMAKLGGIRFGAPPPVRAPPPPARPQEDEPTEHAGEAETEPMEVPAEEGKAEEGAEEEDEQARRQRIAARLANMGGMRFGMMPGAAPPPPSRPPPAREETRSPPPHRAAPPARPPPPPEPKEIEPESETDDGVQVEAEESELEEVTYEDVEEEAPPPPVPSRANRPTHAPPRPPSAGPVSPAVEHRPPVPRIPAGGPGRRSTADSSHSSVTAHPHPPPPSRPPLPPPQQSEYVMVDSDAEPENDVPSLPPSRPTRAPPSRAAPTAPAVPPPPPPPPPAAIEPSDSMTSSQWELPAIPSSTLDFGATSDLSASGFSEDSTTYPTSPPLPPAKSALAEPAAHNAPASAKPTADVDIRPDELMNIWGKVGIQVCEVATTFFEKSKKSLIGDGTYAGFVDAVLREVPNASAPSPPSYGYLVYSQTGSTVHKRVSDIMPGDILTAEDAKLKGHKGLQTYHQNVGTEELLVGVVTEFEAKKSKVRVFQANQHVGQQTVEAVSYRLDDLKSGTIKIYRVLEAS